MPQLCLVLIFLFANLSAEEGFDLDFDDLDTEEPDMAEMVGSSYRL